MDQQHSKSPRSKLSRNLLIAFFFALFMGPGPGLYLINGYAAEGGTILGLPALYLWALFWCAIEGLIVLIAYKTIWKESAV
ncbi:hypothetical protein F7C95_15225 [Opitutia bacterium ISCC 51]|nr:hypothetical protein F7C95_15225 [Opitutae bacterium ISCC 51]QXD27338.1 hypothetical protein GA003_15130 [Opitutae bacterium ISCC 52]